MQLFIMFFLIFFISAALAYLMKYRFEQTVAITCFSVITIIYLFGITGFMAAGVNAVIGIGAAAALFCIIGCIKGFIGKAFLKSNIFTPGFAVFCFFFIFACIMHYGRVLGQTDEFSHWGLVVKNMYVFDAFGNHPEATTFYPGYPPATALFHYFWMKLLGYTEHYFAMSMNVLYFSMFLPLFKNIEWKNKIIIVSAALITMLIPLYPFIFFYSQILVDPVMGILLAYILFAYFTERDFSLPFLLNISLALFVLTLVKASGFGLAVMAALIISFDLISGAWVSRREQPGRELPENKLTDKLKNILKSKTFYIPAVSLFVPVLANQSWSLYRSFTATEYAWNRINDITLIGIAKFFLGRGTPHQSALLRDFIYAFFDMPLGRIAGISFACFQWMVLLAAVCIFFCIKTEGALRRKLINAAAGVFACWALYIFSLLILYAFTFTELEMEVLASYGRYMNTYLLAVMCLITFMYIYFLIEKSKSNNEVPVKSAATFKITALLVILLLTSNLMSIVTLLPAAPDAAGGRSRVTISKIKPLQLDYKQDYIYYIYQNSGGYETLIAVYEMVPVRISEYFSIGTPYPAEGNNIWANAYHQNIDMHEWSAILKNDGYTYVYLEYIDEKFITEFGDLFEDASQIANHSLYKVVINGDDITLRYIDI